MSSFRLDVVSLVPEVFDSLRGLGVIGRAFNAVSCRKRPIPVLAEAKR